MTASTNGAVSITATELNSVGNSVRYFGRSPSKSRVVVRRPAPSKPIRPSPAPEPETASVTVSPLVSAFAVSRSVLAGTRATAEASAFSGFHRNSRTAKR
ncbi:hypothetical protein SCALM49S_01298 [Streptomyces californicus]